MTLYAYPMDRHGCGHYRVIWPLTAIGQEALPHRLVYPGDSFGLAARSRGGVIVGVDLPPDCTGVYLQRPTQEALVDVIPHIQHQGVPVYVDVDDNLEAVSPRHPAFHHLHPNSPRRLVGHSKQAVKRACSLADRVFCSTPELLNVYAKHGRGVLLRNRLPQHALGTLNPRLIIEGSLQSETPGECGGLPSISPHVGQTTSVSNPAEESELIIGWPGNVDTHPDDLTVLNPALQLAGFQRFRVVGPLPQHHHGVDPHGPSSGSKLFGVPTSFTGPIDFEHWLPQLAHHLDVGVAPLAPDTFNKSKSWIKPLELACARVPFVASDTPEYAQLGAGLQAASRKQWQRHLRNLRQSPQLRKEEADRNYIVASSNTYADHRQEWQEAFAL